MKRRSSTLLLISGMAILLGSCSDNTQTKNNEIQYNMISLSESATRSVEKDEMTVNLTIMEEGRTPASLTRQLTEKINNVFKLSPKTEDEAAFAISLTGRYSDRIRKNQWREIASIRIVGTDFVKINELIEQTQDFARIQDISFNISQKKKAQMENELTEEALSQSSRLAR